jgi:hypothetical protein
MKFCDSWVLSLLAVYSELVLGCQIYPLEILNRALQRGPLMTNINSGPNQWSGRTTLASGSATQVVSTFSINSDSLLNLAIQAAVPTNYITRGTQTFANSAAASTVASTSAVYSGQAIHVSLFSATATGSAGTGGGPLRVNSIVDGVSFAISTVDSGGVGTTAPVAMWSIDEAEPRGIKVNSISSGNYFILGWADGKARPIDTTVMWEIRRSS